ncbi:MAG: hypothetical protein IPP40_16550 [bacterium]|nr:hypothetical protein [bacterium]
MNGDGIDDIALA